MTYYPAGKTSHENYGLVKNEEQVHEVFRPVRLKLYVVFCRSAAS